MQIGRTTGRTYQYHMYESQGPYVPIREEFKHEQHLDLEDGPAPCTPRAEGPKHKRLCGRGGKHLASRSVHYCGTTTVCTAVCCCVDVPAAVLVLVHSYIVQHKQFPPVLLLYGPEARRSKLMAFAFRFQTVSLTRCAWRGSAGSPAVQWRCGIAGSRAWSRGAASFRDTKSVSSAVRK